MIGTHSDYFHLDEVVAVMMLKKIHPDYTIIRSRDADVLDKCDILVDVGEIYDHKRCRYDHHQHDFNHFYDVRSQRKKIPMSSAGLIFKHYGDLYVGKFTADVSPSLLSYIYHNVIEAVDAVDNGININPRKSICKQTTLNTIISSLNADDPFDHKIQANRFNDAVAMIDSIMSLVVTDLVKKFSQRKADYDYIVNYFSSSDIPDRRILISDKYLNTIYSTLPKYERDHGHEILYHIYKATTNKWRIRAVSERPGSFGVRKLLPTFEELVKNKFQVEFVHPKRFLAGTFDMETAVAVALYSIRV